MNSVPNEVFVGQKDINERQRRVKYETNVKDTVHLGQVLKAEKRHVYKKERLAFLSNFEFSLPRVHADMSMLSVEQFFCVGLGSICYLSCLDSCLQTYVLRKIKTARFMLCLS